jgi:hypothetical protein
MAFEIRKDVDRTHKGLAFFNQSHTEEMMMRILIMWVALGFSRLRNFAYIWLIIV